MYKFIIGVVLGVILAIAGVVTIDAFFDRQPIQNYDTPLPVVTVVPTTIVEEVDRNPIQPTRFPIAELRNTDWKVESAIEKPVSQQAEFRPNSVFLGTYQKKLVMLIKHTEGSNLLARTQQPEYTSVEADYSKLTDPVTIYNGGDVKTISFMGFVSDSSFDHVYVSLLVDVLKDGEVSESKIMDFTTSEQSKRILYRKLVFSEKIEKYNETELEIPGYYGALNILDLIADRYMVFSVEECFNCGISTMNYVIVSDLMTGTDLKLGAVTDLVFDLDKGSVAYKEVSYDDSQCKGIQEPCVGVYKTGETAKTNLP